MHKPTFLVIPALLALAGCKSEDNSHYAVSRQYQELKFAYERCLGDLQYDDGKETFDQRLACTAAVYGGTKPQLRF